MKSEFLVKNWYRARGYLHFDSRLGAASLPKVEKYVSNPINVVKHPFVPFLRFEKPKHKIEFIEGKGRRHVPGVRPICYAAHMDSQIYAYYATVLAHRYEQILAELGLSENVIAFRQLVSASGEPKCNIHLADDAFRAIIAVGPCTAFAFDVRKFFDTLDRRTLRRQWCAVLGVSELPDDHYAVFKSMTRYKYVNRDAAFGRFGIPKNRGATRNHRVICTREELNDEAKGTDFVKTEPKGIPQGSPISAMLANIYMLPFDTALAEAMKLRGGFYFRYCDDILCVLPEGETIDVVTLVQTELAKIHLEINPKKTDISTFSLARDGVLNADKSIQYLGFKFDGRRERISIRPGSVQRYRKKLSKRINLAIQSAIKHNSLRKAAGKPAEAVYLKKVFRGYSHIGRRNFVTYARRAFKVMGSSTIQRQVLDFDKFFVKEVARARAARIVHANRFTSGD